MFSERALKSLMEKELLAHSFLKSAEALEIEVRREWVEGTKREFNSEGTQDTEFTEFGRRIEERGQDEGAEGAGGVDGEESMGNGSRGSYQLSIDFLVYWMLIRIGRADSNGSGGSRED